MQGIIIAGGFGTRLRPLTYTRPKHLLPVANRPFLEYQVALLRRHGVTEIVFATNYFAEQIEAHFGDGSRFGVHLRYAVETVPLGTAGAIRNAAALLPSETLLVLNGDVLTDFDLSALWEFHRSRRAGAVVAARRVAQPHPFGVLQLGQDGRIAGWHEPSEEQKRRAATLPDSADSAQDHINAGIYLLEPDLLCRIPTGRPVSIERETYPLLIAEGYPLYSAAPPGYWLDIGRPGQYLAANEAVLTGAVQTDVPFLSRETGGEIDESASIDGATVLGRGVRIGPGSLLTGCVLLDGVTVGARTTLRGVIADAGAQIGDEVTAREGVTLASETRIARGSIL